MHSEELRALNQRVHQYFLSNPRHRLLIHALDPCLLTDADFQKISDVRLSEDQLLDYPWVLALFWGRLFYKNSDGNNYRKVIQDALAIRSPDSLFARIHTTCGWFPEDSTLLDRRTYRFQAECWLTNTEGETSKLWNSLRRFVRRAAPGSGNEQICSVSVSDEEDITPPVRWLLEQIDEDFCDTLRWLHLGAKRGASIGNDVGGVVADNCIYANLIKKDDFSASFGLRVVGNRGELVLVIKNISFGTHDIGDTRKLCVKQNGKIIFQGLISRRVPSIVLGEREFSREADFSKSIEVCLGNMFLDSNDIDPISWEENDLLIFRQSDNGNVSRYISGDHKHHVQGRYFYVLGRLSIVEPPVLTFGGTQLNMLACGPVSHALSTRHLFRLDLGELSARPAPLSEQGASRPALIIGRKPYLSVDPSPSDWRLHGGDETPVMVGHHKLTICAKNFICKQISLSVTNSQGNVLECSPHPNNPLLFALNIGQEDWGKKWRIRAKSEMEGDEASSEYLFLPGMNSPGVNWTPSNVPDAVRFDHARMLELEDGILSYPGGSTEALRPIGEPTWAWSQPLREFQDFGVERQFIYHEDTAGWRIHYVLPTGRDWALRFNEQLVSSISGSINLVDLTTEHLGPDEMGENIGATDNLQIIDTTNPASVLTVSRILRNPRHPAVGIVNGVPSIYIPEAFQQAGWRLFFIRESSLLDGRLYEIGLDSEKLEPGDTYQISDLAKLMPDEGAWLVLLDLGACRTVPVGGLMEFGGILQMPQVSVSGICEIATEGAGQTFPKLLEIWNGLPLENQKIQQACSLLNLLDHCLRQASGSHRIGKTLARARRDRRLLGFGSYDLLNQYFDAELLSAVGQGRSAIEKLLFLLLECGLNWFAEARWIEALPERMKSLLPPGRRCTRAMKETLRDACPLTNSFELIHCVDRGGIRGIDQRFFHNQINQVDIGLSIACPKSTVPVFQKGLPFRGFSAQAIVLQQQRPVLWPPNYRDAVEIKDSQGEYHQIIIKVTSFDKAARFVVGPIKIAQELWFDSRTTTIIKRLFKRGLNSASYLIGSPRNPPITATNLGVLFRACSARIMWKSRNVSEPNHRATIFQLAVLSRLHAWITYSHPAPDGWPLSDPTAYDQVARALATIWNSPAHRKVLEKDMALIEWLITWFKNPDFCTPEHV